ncbi:hypothetical protein [Protaetiibacter sp. SSC-01]|uniref:hypothetical protein n=1 Tax=Protaetiibacter sp. SSC-01 TaxID=2759943 RepID=UPI00223B554C|nr:hypothetical protein [Protaetiibacter sp. SSC-01]
MRAGRVLDAQLHILDRQVLDVDGVPVTAIDDLELGDVPLDTDLAGVEPPEVENLLSGAVLGTRIFGGRPPSSRWHRIPWGAIRELGTAIHLDVRADELELTWPERWVREHVIGRIPGGRHDPE